MGVSELNLAFLRLGFVDGVRAYPSGPKSSGLGFRVHRTPPQSRCNNGPKPIKGYYSTY